MRMGDLSLARALLEQALAIEQALAPDSTQVADTLNNLGYVLQAQGNHKDAQAYYQRALALYEKHAPGSPRVASIINNLALLAWERRRLRKRATILNAPAPCWSAPRPTRRRTRLCSPISG